MTDTLRREFAAVGSQLERGAGAATVLRSQLAQHRAQAETLTEEAGQLEQVVVLLQAMQEVWKQRFEAAVGQVVSRGLTAVFGEQLDLLVELGQSGSQPTARFAVRDSRGLETDVIDARGGGLVNVAAFLLRVLLLLSARPPMARILILDETFVNVSAEYGPALVELLRRIVDEGGFQILLVSHRDDLTDAADVVYRFHTVEGKTAVRQEKSAEDAVAESSPIQRVD